jgi:2-alkyl-3-oxoalkanoate reductase
MRVLVVGATGAIGTWLVPQLSGQGHKVIGSAGIMPFSHLHDAASATVLALEHDGPAIYNITDDEPAPPRDWLPVLAEAAGAKPPRHAPAWLGRMLMGEALGVMAESRGASNAKAKAELGWTLRYPSWRQGFVAAYGQASPVQTAA